MAELKLNAEQEKKLQELFPDLPREINWVNFFMRLYQNMPQIVQIISDLIGGLAPAPEALASGGCNHEALCCETVCLAGQTYKAALHHYEECCKHKPG